MKISTITPCYKGEKYLPLFLQKLPQQTIFDQIEVVLDHNEPTEQEIQMVKEFQKQYPGRLKHIIVDKVDPIGKSMNRCIKEAQGEYVAIWNIDDLRTPWSLEAQARVLDENQDIGVSHGNFIIVPQFGLTEGRFVDHFEVGTSPNKELTRSMVLGPFFMWRKNLSKTVGYFDEQLVSGADFDLAIRLAIHSKVGMTSKILGYYLDEGKGASTRPENKQLLERTVIELRYGILDKIEKRMIDEARSKYNTSRIYWDEGSSHITEMIPDYKNFWRSNGRK
jgi:GT2 family glycosyltransferase